MLDPKLLRNDLEGTTGRLARRGFQLDAKAFSALEEQRKAIQIDLQDLQKSRNDFAKKIGQAKARGEDAGVLLSMASAILEVLQKRETELGKVKEDLDRLLLGIPNIPHESVPEGKDANDNVEIRRF